LPDIAAPLPIDVVRSDAADATPAPITPAASPATAPAAPQLPPIDPWSVAALVWFAGVVVALAVQLRNQSRFMADARRGIAGPAVVGFLRPRIVTPADFEQKFESRERAIILAHETVHLDRSDARINTLVALLRCLCWFNPLIHAGAHFMRIDQELACDAAVTERHPRERAVYAAALLKAQLASRPLPMGCHWPARSAHPLLERIEMLKRAKPGKRARLAGAGVLALLAVISGAAAWAAQPPVTHYTTLAAPPVTMPAANAPAPSPLEPEPQLPEPQQTPAPPAPSAPTAYDPTDPVYLRGKVERIDFGATKYTVFVRASSVAKSEIDEPVANAQLWELSPTSYWGDRDAVNADLKDQVVVVRGYNAADKSCAPTCKLLMRGIIVPKSTALPAVPASASFGVVEVNEIYDPGRQYVIEGRVQRIAFSDHVFDAYVLTEPTGPVPGRLFQVRSEYRFPPAEIEKQLLNQVVAVKGWPARKNISMDLDTWSIYSNCEATCAMYGADFMRDDRVRITPAGDQLTPPVSSGSLFLQPSGWALDNNLVLTGKVKEVDGYGAGIKLVVEEISRAPTPSAGSRPGTVWSVYFTPETPGALPMAATVRARRWVGRTLTFSGIPVESSSGRIAQECEKDCQLQTSDAMAFD
jgi:hypothetical protein